jgi:hypothetical protein
MSGNSCVNQSWLEQFQFNGQWANGGKSASSDQTGFPFSFLFLFAFSHDFIPSFANKRRSAAALIQLDPFGAEACASIDLRTPSACSSPRSRSSSISSAVSVESLPTGKIISPSAVCIGKPTATPCCRNSLTAFTISSARSAKLLTTSSPSRHHCGNGGARLGDKDGLPTGFSQLLHRHEPPRSFRSAEMLLTGAAAWFAPLVSLP